MNTPQPQETPPLQGLADMLKLIADRENEILEKFGSWEGYGEHLWNGGDLQPN